MTQIALSASIYADKSTATIEDFNYTRAYNARLDVDNSSALIEDTNSIRSIKAELIVDKSTVKVTPCLYKAFTATLEVDSSRVSLNTNKINAHFAYVYSDESTVKLTPSVCHPLEATIYSDSSNPTLQPSILRALKSDIYTDKSSLRVEEFTRAILGEPPFGEMKVDVRGTDVPLNGFNLLKNGTYPINVWVYWDRLSVEGTDLIFTIKQSTNPNQPPYAIRSTDGKGITVIKIEPHGSTGLDAYKAQIVLRPSDMVALPNKSTKLFYELLLRDSLNEDYIIDRGSFTVNPPV